MAGATFSAGAFCCAAGAGLDISLLLFCSLFSAAMAALAISSDAATVVNRCTFLIAHSSSGPPRFQVMQRNVAKPARFQTALFRPDSRAIAFRVPPRQPRENWLRAVKNAGESALAILTSSIDQGSDEFRANAERMRGLIDDLAHRRAEAAQGGPRKARERHVSRGKLLPRDRVMNLIDPGSPFLELSPLAANGLYEDQIHAAGIITGIGRVSGRECVIVANDSTIKGGTYYPLTVKKHLRAQ